MVLMSHVCRRSSIYLIFLLFPLVLSARDGIGEDTVSVKLYFCKNGTQFDPLYRENFKLLEKLFEDTRLQENPDLRIIITTSSSADGVSTHNLELSRQRADNMRHYLTSCYEISSDRIELNPLGIDWDDILYQSSISNDLSSEEKRQIHDIITGMPEWVYDNYGNAIDSRKKRLMDMNGGATWNKMLLGFFHEQRYGRVSVIIPEASLPEELDTIPLSNEIHVEDVDTMYFVESVAEQLVPVTVTENTAVTIQYFDRSINIKTNMVGLGMLVANLGLEYEKDGKWSVCIPVYFCGWDYCMPTTKFRCMYMQPEFRWYSAMSRFYTAVHIGAGYYDVCLSSGEYRYQDKGGAPPFVNAGVSVGFRHTFGRSRKWLMEYSIGGGYMTTEYDKYDNTDNGRLLDTGKFNGFVIDQATISVVYRMPLLKKARK